MRSATVSAAAWASSAAIRAAMAAVMAAVFALDRFVASIAAAAAASAASSIACWAICTAPAKFLASARAVSASICLASAISLCACAAADRRRRPGRIARRLGRHRGCQGGRRRVLRVVCTRPRRQPGLHLLPRPPPPRRQPPSERPCRRHGRRFRVGQVHRFDSGIGSGSSGSIDSLLGHLHRASKVPGIR